MSKIADIKDSKLETLLKVEEHYFNTPVEVRSYRNTGNGLGMSKDKVRHAIDKIKLLREAYPADDRLTNKNILFGTKTPVEATKIDLPKKGKTKTYIFTSCQNNTKVFKEFFDNLVAYSEFLDAELHVGTFTYSHNNNSEFTVKRGTNKEQNSLWWDSSITDYISDDRISIAPDLVWNGDWNIIPTVEDPVSALDSYLGSSSNIFPHVKNRQKAIPVQKGTPVKRNMTTGAVSQLNYVQRKAGMKAEFDHVFSAIIVEVDHKGNWSHRQLVADSDNGSFYDLNLYVDEKLVNHYENNCTIIHGDIHSEQFNHDLYDVVWGADDSSVFSKINIDNQVFHDVLDFKARNHHEKNNAFSGFKKYTEGTECVKSELKRTSELLKSFQMDGVFSYVAYSNHDDMLERWLSDHTNDFRKDNVNAIIYLKLMLRMYEAIENDEMDEFSIFSYSLNLYEDLMKQVHFAHNVDESHIINGIEILKHGHQGHSGSRGSLKQYATYGQKIVVGHYHKGEIMKGAVSVGVFGNLEMGYNKGYSAWTHSFCLIYPNGKRTLVDIKQNHMGEYFWRL